MASNIFRDDRDTPHHPIEHRDIIHISKKLDYTSIFYSPDINSLNQTRARLWQEAYMYLSKIPMPNLPVKGVPLPNVYQ